MSIGFAASSGFADTSSFADSSTCADNNLRPGNSGYVITAVQCAVRGVMQTIAGFQIAAVVKMQVTEVVQIAQL